MKRPGIQTGSMLDGVCSRDIAYAALTVSRFDPVCQTTAEDRVLRCCDAQWWYAPHSGLSEAPGPRHRTIRYKGRAPEFPDAPQDATHGTLTLRPTGLALQPGDPEAPPHEVAAPSIHHAAFFGDAISITLRDGRRIVIRCEDVTSLNTLFEAYF